MSSASSGVSCQTPSPGSNLPAATNLIASSEAAASRLTDGWAASSLRAFASTGRAARIGSVIVRPAGPSSVNSTIPSRGASASRSVAGPDSGTKLTSPPTLATRHPPADPCPALPCSAAPLTRL